MDGTIYRRVHTEGLHAVVWDVMRRHRAVAAVLVGLLIVLVRVACEWLAVPVSELVKSAVALGLYVLALVALDWPWMSYALARRLSLAAAATLACVGSVNALVRDPRGWDIVPWIFPVGLVLTSMVFGAVVLGILFAFTFVRKRYWPVYPPGHCRRCGYDLRGQIELRCPECGTSFERAESEPK